MKWIHNAIQHIKTINHHKKLVMQGCFRLGLYRQGLLHDLSKYTWPELRIGIRYFRDGQSPHNGEREVNGYSTAWLHHKGRNKHHMEYWIDYTPDPQDRHIAGMRMPVKYVIEMFVDRISASKNYRKERYKDTDPLEYYEGRKHYMAIHDDTRKQLEILLHMLADVGEEETFQYIRRHILRNNHLEKLQHLLKNSHLEKLQHLLKNSYLEKLLHIFCKRG